MFDVAKFAEYLTKANSKRDLASYGIALNNPTCVYKANKILSMNN